MAKRKEKIKINKELKRIEKSLKDKLDMLYLSDNTLKELENKRKEEMSEYEKNCRLVFDYLEKRNFKEIKATFDGCGDSGQLEELTADNQNSKELFNEMVPFSAIHNGTEWDEKKKEWIELPHREGTLGELLEQIVYDKLNADHSGWEINSGSFGEFVFNIKKRKINFVYNERYEEINTSEDEETF